MDADIPSKFEIFVVRPFEVNIERVDKLFLLASSRSPFTWEETRGCREGPDTYAAPAE